MTQYDIASYIGFRKGILPDEVYIHRGVRNGAYTLGLIKFRTKDDKLDINKVYTKCPALRKLDGAMHIENFLCINKKQLEVLKQK